MSGVGRIGGPSSVGATVPRRSADGGFHVPNEPGRASQAAAPSPVALDALLALQDEEEPTRDRAARRQARRLLAGLDALHAALLGRGAPDLAGLAGLLEAMPEPACDPCLREAVEAITLRCRVELARYATGP